MEVMSQVSKDTQRQDGERKGPRGEGGDTESPVPADSAVVSWPCQRDLSDVLGRHWLLRA